MNEYRIKAIYVMPYVAAYYEKHGLENSDRLLLQALLQNPNARFDKAIPEYFGTLIPWAPIVPKSWLFDYGVELSKTNARIFSNYLGAKVREKFELCFRMELEYCRAMQIKFSIKNCLQRVRDTVIDLDEDSLLLETIVKHIQRWCKKNNIYYSDVLKFTRNNVLNFPAQNAHNKLPEGYISIQDFCTQAQISERHFYNVLRSEIAIEEINGCLAIPLAKYAS